MREQDIVLSLHCGMINISFMSQEFHFLAGNKSRVEREEKKEKHFAHLASFVSPSLLY